MAQMFVNLGANAVLGRALNSSIGNLTLRLYTNSHTLASTDAAAQLTEATGGGYSAITLTDGSWTIAFTGSIYTATYAQQTFTCTGPFTTNQTAYGYYITDGAGVVWPEEAFATAFTPFKNGDAKPLTTKIQLSHGTPAA